MERTVDAASSLESGIVRAGSENDRAPTADLASQVALSSTPRSAEDGAWFVPENTEPAEEHALHHLLRPRHHLGRHRALRNHRDHLTPIPVHSWEAPCLDQYRYVLLPSMLPERTTQAPEQKRKLLVVVVEATGASRAPLAHTRFPHFGRNHSGTTWSNTTPTASPLLTAPYTAVATTVTRTVPEEDLLPAPL
ncbi:hypothetical protein MTO96_017374 [Rhipicephalus appendiculatus]